MRPDTARWQSAAEQRAQTEHFDTVVETALADPAEIRAAAEARRASTPRRLEVLALSTPEAMCQLAALVRFLREAAHEGGGRYASWQNHNSCAAGLLRTLATVEAERLVDRITVVRRDGAVLYVNELRDSAR